MYTFYQKIIYILFFIFIQFAPAILKLYKNSFFVNYMNFLWFNRILGFFILLVSFYIVYISVVPFWPYVKNQYPFSLFFKK
jgi:hypothetical protein